MADPTTEIDSVPPAPERRPDDHKGRFGHVLVLAGSPRMTGAALLASRAALRSGPGLVTLGVPAAIHPLVAPAVLDCMTLPLPGTRSGAFSRDAIQPTLDFVSGVQAVALGPGITTEDQTVEFANRVAQRARVPLVLDADGLNCLAKMPSSLRAAGGPRVLTPHPGEAARLLVSKVPEVQADRVGSAQSETATNTGIPDLITDIQNALVAAEVHDSLDQHTGAYASQFVNVVSRSDRLVLSSESERSPLTATIPPTQARSA